MDRYTGYKIISANDPNLSDFYSHPDWNIYFSNIGEYLVVLDTDGYPADAYCWTDEKYRHITYKPIKNDLLGKIAPRNIEQRLAFDMLQNEQSTVKVLTGCFGSGKTFLMVAHAMSQILDGKFEKLVWVRNNIEVKDTVSLGALPGTAEEKLAPYVGPLADHLGGMEQVNDMIFRNQIEIQHLGFIRGRDIKNSIIISSEAENLTKQHVQLLIGRVGEGSNLWIEGDYSQVDKKVFEDNSGLRRMVDRLAGDPLFQYVNLPTTERSATARLADKLD